MPGLSAANETFSVQSILHLVPTHFIILRVAHSHRGPTSGFTQLTTPSYTYDVHGRHFLHSVPACFYLYKVFIFARLSALFLLAICCQVWNGSPSNFTTASGKRKVGKNHKVFHFNVTSEWIMGSFKLAFSHTIRCRFNMAELSAGPLANRNVTLLGTKYWLCTL